METMVQELRRLIRFKDTTRIGDLVLVAIAKTKSVFYALVTDIQRDDSRRDEWWHLTLQVLTVPPQKVIWTLREPQFTGKEIFTMEGDGRFLQALDFAVGQPVPEPLPPRPSKVRPTLKRVK